MSPHRRLLDAIGRLGGVEVKLGVERMSGLLPAPSIRSHGRVRASAGALGQVDRIASLND